MKKSTTKKQLAIFNAPNLESKIIPIDDSKGNIKKQKYRDKSFDYGNVDTGWGVHGIHPYPAMMIFPVARRFLILKRGL